MTKGFMQDKARAMNLFWVTARQVVWRSQPHSASCQHEKKDNEAKKNDHPRR